MKLSDSRSKNTTRNIIFSFANQIVAVLFPFITRTVILNVLGADYLGLNSLFTSILSFLNLAELGIGSAIVFAMYKPCTEKNIKLMNALLNYYRKFYIRIGCTVLGVGILALPFLEILINGNPPENSNIYILFVFFLCNTTSSYFFSGYRQSLFIVNQRSDIISKITLCVNVISQTIQIILLAAFKNYYLFATIPIIGTIAINMISAKLSQNRYPSIICDGELEDIEKKEIKKRLSGLIGTKLNSVMVHSADTLVISAFLGLRATAIYGNYFYVLNGVNAFVILIFSSMTASVGNSLLIEKNETNKALFDKIQFINAWITGVCSVCLLCLYHRFISLWTGETLTYSLSVEALLVIYFFVYTIQRTIVTFKDAAGIWYEDRYRPYICMVVNVVLNIVSIQYIGIYGVLLSSIISFIISIPWTNAVLFKSYFGESGVHNLIALVKYAIVTALSCLVTWYITNMLPKGVLGFIICLPICAVLPNVIFLLVYSRTKEFYLMKEMILQRVVGRKKNK